MMSIYRLTKKLMRENTSIAMKDAVKEATKIIMEPKPTP